MGEKVWGSVCGVGAVWGRQAGRQGVGQVGWGNHPNHRVKGGV